MGAKGPRKPRKAISSSGGPVSPVMGRDDPSYKISGTPDPKEPEKPGMFQLIRDLGKAAEDWSVRWQTAKLLAAAVKEITPEKVKANPKLLDVMRRMAEDILQ